jgi:hypothetical protein
MYTLMHRHEVSAPNFSLIRGYLPQRRAVSSIAPKVPMTVRTTTTRVTFRHPFSIRGADGALPPGIYAVETQEEQLPGLSFLAYRRISTRRISTTIVLSAPYGGRPRQADDHDRAFRSGGSSGARPPDRRCLTSFLPRLRLARHATCWSAPSPSFRLYNCRAAVAYRCMAALMAAP